MQTILDKPALSSPHDDDIIYIVDVSDTTDSTEGSDKHIKWQDLRLKWSQVTEKPTTFPSHWATLQNKPTVFPTNWANVADKPSIVSATDALNISGLWQFNTIPNTLIQAPEPEEGSISINPEHFSHAYINGPQEGGEPYTIQVEKFKNGIFTLLVRHNSNVGITFNASQFPNISNVNLSNQEGHTDLLIFMSVDPSLADESSEDLEEKLPPSLLLIAHKLDILPD